MYKAATFVKGSGPKETCKLAAVGEQPGAQEIIRGIPFIGPAGEELVEDMRLAEILYPEVYLTNCIKDLDRPLDSYCERRKTDYRMSDEALYYKELLRNELASCSANCIVAVGGVALWFLCNRVGINSWRGSILESTLLPGRKVIPILHPATVIPPKNVYTNKRLIVMDLIRAKEQSEFPDFRYVSRNARLAPSFYDCAEWLDRIYHRGLAGEAVYFDIELYNEEISCIGFSTTSSEALCIPFIDHNGDYFSLEQESAIWLAIGRILEDSRIIKRNQNIGFDVQMILRRYGIKSKNLQCIMVAQRLILPDYPVALEFPTSLFTDIPYYKADGKRWFKVGGAWKTLWHYNCLDVLGPPEIFHGQIKYLEQQQNMETFYEQCRLIEPLTYMQERGIKVDIEGMKQEFYRCSKELETVTEKINSLVGYAINANSPDQLKDYFYRTKGLKPYKTRNAKGEWVVTTNEEALIRIKRRNDCGEASEVAELILQSRRLVKRKGTYLPIDEVTGDLRKIDSDGRIRCSYNAAGTKTGRLSSSEDIFGKGMDLQNWPHDLLTYLVPDTGYIYYTLDLSQIENRIVAYVGNIREMIEAFENEIDVHTLTSALIFRKPFDQISREAGSCSLGDGTHSERDWGKKANHAFNYDYGYKSFAMKYEMPESEAKWIYERYHTAYPGVRESYHAYVKGELRKTRSLVNLFGRSRMFLGRLDDFTFQDAYAQIPQSTTADKINRQGINFVYYNQTTFGALELLIQIHDAIGFQLPLSISFREHARMILEIKRSLETSLRFQDREFVVPVDLSMGFNLNKNQGFEIKHKNFPDDVDKLAEVLEVGLKTLTED